MSGKLEPLRRLVSKPPFKVLRDAFVRLAWRLDPDLTALGWIPVHISLSENRRKEFLSWNKYDDFNRKLRSTLEQDAEWRQGPRKCWAVAQGPMQALQHITSKPLHKCIALDFGCGSHFSDSTGLILYFVGVGHIDAVDLGNLRSGFQTGAALDLVHWLKDQILVSSPLPMPQSVRIETTRLDEVHRCAVEYQSGGICSFHGVSTLQEDIFGSAWNDRRYDLITSNAVLEHVLAPESIWRRFVHLLNPGGG